MQSEGRVGPIYAADGSVETARLGKTLETITADAHGRYYEAASRGKLYVAHAIVTAPVIYTTAAGTGGPLIWNPVNSGINVNIVGVGFGVTVVSTVAAALGITGNSGQTAAPASTTAIDSQRSTYIGAAAAGQASAYRIGTPTNAGNFLVPFADLQTGALTTSAGRLNWVDLGGVVVAPPGTWVSVAASATASTTVAQLALVYEEVPV
jgi:hypothetical protein